MKKQIQIGGSISGVIATGPYQNLKPQFSWYETIEDCDFDDNKIESREKEIYEKLTAMLKEAEQTAVAERIRRERKDMRFLKSPNTGKLLPSVTSIINYDSDFFVTPDELVQYASQGNIIDGRVKHYIESGMWEDAKNLKELWSDIVIITRGSLKLELNVGSFPGFLEKYPINDMVVGKRFFNDIDEYTGEPDFIGVPGFSGAEKIKTIFDIKRTSDKIKNGMQLSAYCRHYNIEQGIIIQINGKTKQGYSKPIIYDETTLDGYFEMFSKKQSDFKKRYNI